MGGCMAVRRSYEVAQPQKHSNYWSSTENSTNNAWNVNFNSGNVNNNNNKYNTNNVVRPVAALDGLYHDFPLFYLTVREAYDDCLRGKMSSPQALEYMQIAEEDLPKLAWEMFTGTYEPSTSTCFLVEYPKLREVFAANFRDRIVHHWICLRLEPLFEERFEAQGNVSFNCRKGYGVQKAVNAVSTGFERVSCNYTRPAWVFKGDLVGFFMSISKSRLWYLLERFIARRYHGDYKDILVNLTRVTVMHHPERNCIFNTDPAKWLGLARNKSMFTCGEDRGEPIGNLTTQLFANFLLSFFDMFVQFVFRGRSYSYARFVDDFVLACDDEAFLLASIPRLDAFLRDVLLLELHKDKRYIQPVTHGVKFVGAVIKPHRSYLSNKTIGRMFERVHGFNDLCEQKDELTVLDCARIEQVMNSYLGFCRPHRTYRLRRKALERFGPMFYRYFYIRNHHDSIRTKMKYRPITVPPAELSLAA